MSQTLRIFIDQTSNNTIVLAEEDGMYALKVGITNPNTGEFMQDDETQIATFPQAMNTFIKKVEEYEFAYWSGNPELIDLTYQARLASDVKASQTEVLY